MAMLSAASSGSSELSTLTESVRRSLTEQGSLQAISCELRSPDSTTDSVGKKSEEDCVCKEGEA